MLSDAGFKAPILSDFCSELWLKLTFERTSALTYATPVDICRFPETRPVAEAMMTQAQAVRALAELRDDSIDRQGVAVQAWPRPRPRGAAVAVA
ncbi:MAG: hypothetical protein GWN34_19945 [Gammaproteobacteria bacterium]|nr:hypothetical protein [Gammaproteobacteria bacterium]